MLQIDHKKYLELKKLYQYHKDRNHLDSMLHIILPKRLCHLFFRYYRLENNRLTKISIGVLKSILFGNLFLAIFSLLKTNDLQGLMFFHLFFLWAYISSEAFQLDAQNALNKNDMLMLLMSEYRKPLFVDVTKEKLLYSYFSSLVPLTLVPVVYFSIVNHTYLDILGFILFQVIGYVVVKFVVIMSYKLKYLRMRHSFFKELIMSIGFTVLYAILFFIVLYPSFFIIDLEKGFWVYPVIMTYTILIVVIGTIVFNRFIHRFVKENAQAIMYPKALSSKEKSNIRFLKSHSIFLRGLSDIEKAIVIKDQKMFKRKNRKDYYGSYFYGFVLLFSAIPFISRIYEYTDTINLLSTFMIFSGLAVTLHMFETVMLNKYVSYTSEKSLVLTYQRLSVSTKQIFNAKVRMFSYMLMPLLLTFFTSSILVFIHFSVEKLVIFIFVSFYFIGFSRLKLRNNIHTDTQYKKAYLLEYQHNEYGMGNAIVLGIFAIFIIPLGFSLFADQLYKAFGIYAVYLLMGITVILIVTFNMINDMYISKKQKEVTYD